MGTIYFFRKAADEVGLNPFYLASSILSGICAFSHAIPLARVYVKFTIYLCEWLGI